MFETSWIASTLSSTPFFQFFILFNYKSFLLLSLKTFQFTTVRPHVVKSILTLLFLSWFLSILSNFPLEKPVIFLNFGLLSICFMSLKWQFSGYVRKQQPAFFSLCCSDLGFKVLRVIISYEIRHHCFWMIYKHFFCILLYYFTSFSERSTMFFIRYSAAVNLEFNQKFNWGIIPSFYKKPCSVDMRVFIFLLW